MINHHPKIVTSGLVLNVDPANPKSYPAKDDPYVGNVSLLLPFDGANNSTTFTDFSVNNLTVTVNDGAKISTTQSKFGGSAGYFDGTNDYISVTNASLFDFSASDWTIEMWIYFDSAPNWNGLVGESNGGGNIPKFGLNLNYGTNHFSQSNRVGFFTNISGVDRWINVAYTWTNSTWYHIAVVQSGSTITLYVNGQSVGSMAFKVSSGITGNFRIGSDGEGYKYFTGYIDDFRITKAARYTANFTPPDRLTALPGRIYDLTTNKGTGSFVGSGVSYSSTNAGIVTLDGSNGYGVLPNTLTVGPTSTFTLCAWVNYISRPTAGVARRSVLDQSANTNDFEPILGFPYTYSASKMGLEVGKAGVASQIAYSSYTNNLNEWYYLTGLFKNGSADFYINGVYQSTVTYSATVNSATANTKNWGIGGVFFNGSITSPYANCRVGPVQVYNRNLTASEITQNYNAAKGRFGL